MDYIVKAYKDWKLHSQFQEIVPEDSEFMEDTEFMFNEKQSIRESARSLKKYGSTTRHGCNHLRNNETLVRHIVEKTDTLQGIALKYGCTTEQIRRANRLFASDSLFLRQFLLVPVERTSPYYPQTNSNGQIPTAATTPTTGLPIIPTSETQHQLQQQQQQQQQQEHEQHYYHQQQQEHFDAADYAIISGTNRSSAGAAAAALPTRPYSIAGELLVQTSDQEDPALINHNASSSKQSKSLDSVVVPMTPEEENRKCMNDFLNKIDNTISESRKYVERSKDMVNNQSDDLFAPSDFVQSRRNDHLNNSYKNNNNRPSTHHQRHSSTGSGNSDTAQLLLNTTQTRRVQNSLKRLEKQQDDFFEL